MGRPDPLLSEQEILSAAGDAAKRFLGVDLYDWRKPSPCIYIEFTGSDLPYGTLHRGIWSDIPNVGGSFCPQPAYASLSIRRDWHEAVYLRGFVHLGPPAIGKNALFLHVEPKQISGQSSVAKAVWSHGGGHVVEGYVAYRREYWSQRITTWAVGTTASRAMKRLEQGIRNAVEAAPTSESVPVEDLEALGQLTLP